MVNENLSSVILLSIGPPDKHQSALAEILNDSMEADSRWTLISCSSASAARPLLGKGRVPIVLCDQDQRPGEWRQLLEILPQLPAPPYLIVTSQFADDRLWSEALHLGAYDVLAKPFAAAEVIRVLRVAWLRWQEQYLRTDWLMRRQALACSPARATA